MKYRYFRTMARVIEIIAWVMGLGVFVGSLALGLVTGGASIAFGIITGVIGGLLSFIYFYCLAQFIYVVIDIERNTRRTLRALLEEVETEEVETEEEVKAEKGE